MSYASKLTFGRYSNYAIIGFAGVWGITRQNICIVAYTHHHYITTITKDRTVSAGVPAVEILSQ